MKTILVLMLFLMVGISIGQNHTNERLDLPYNAGPLLMVIQRVSERLTAIETLLSQQMRKLDLIDYKLTKMEVLNNEKSSEKVKDDNGILVKKIEDLEWEIHKFGTLLDVVRGDLDKVLQRQTEIKAVGGGGILVKGRKPNDDDSITELSELSAKIQVLTGHINTLRRINEALQVNVQSHGVSLNTVANITREMSSNNKQLLTKSYFQNVLKDALDSKPFLQLSSTGQCEGSIGEPNVAEDCTILLEAGHNRSGIYRIRPKGSLEPFYVWCDMDTEGGGWTVFQRRTDGTLDFYQEWPEYKSGFGNIAGEHWLGNDKLHYITKNVIQRLRIEMEDLDNDKVAAEYSAFSVGSHSTSYAIQILGNYQGEAGDSFSYHAGMKFSTKDVDNDQWEGGSCARDHKGAWWYKGCDMSNLNGMYLSGTTPENMHYQGMYWYEWHGPAYSVQKTIMMIRPDNYQIRKQG